MDAIELCCEGKPNHPEEKFYWYFSRVPSPYCLQYYFGLFFFRCKVFILWAEKYSKSFRDGYGSLIPLPFGVDW